MDRLCLTDVSIQALQASVGSDIAGVLVPDRNRDLRDRPSSLGIVLSSGSYLHLYPTSIDHAGGEYFRLEVEALGALPPEFVPREPVHWAIVPSLMRGLVGASINAAEVLREQMDEWGLVDVGVRFVTSSDTVLTVRGEHRDLPMTLEIEVTDK